MRMSKPQLDGLTLARALDLVSERGWFAERDETVRQQLGRIARLRIVPAGKALYVAGDEANGVYGLVAGGLDISIPRADGTDFTFHHAERGFWVGDLAMLTGARRLVSVRAASEAAVLHLGGAELTAMIRATPELLRDFYALTYANFATTFFLLANVSISSSESRVALRLLLQLEAAPDADGWVALSQSKLAELVALSQPTLQRAMRRLTEMGLIEPGYGRIRVADRAGLLELCGGSADLGLPR